METYLPPMENAVAAIRVSSIKQGLQGDSPEAQKEQIEAFAKVHNINVKKFFIFMESASKEEQPVQEAIDYCKNSKNGIQVFVIKSIDRFTRGGSYLYDHLKMQLTKYGVKLVDIYGIIGTQDINTLEHLGVKYDWSVYSPTKKSEILEAERAKDEMRDIMSRMIGAEIRYVRLGYRVRSAPFGYINEKAETAHGRRVILKPHPEESEWILKMYDFRLRGDLTDQEIVDELNRLGFKSRLQLLRDPHDRTKIRGKRGGNKLILRQFHDYVANPIYVGVNMSKWTDYQPIKGKFQGLVSLEVFNKANRGKIVLVEDGEGLKVFKEKPADFRLKKLWVNPKYPYKKYVLCPICKGPLLGSASRGKSGKYFPVYHCDRSHKRFSVPVKEFEETITSFVKSLRITKEGVDKLKKASIDEWATRISSSEKDAENLEKKLEQLEFQEKSIVEKMQMLNSEVAIKLMEEEVNKVDAEIVRLKHESKKERNKEVPIDIVLEVVGYFMEHLENLLLESPDPLRRADYFGLVFEERPTYNDLIYGTPKLAPYIELINILNGPKGPLVPLEGIAPSTNSSEASCSIC